jgi:hypothetical protein
MALLSLMNTRRMEKGDNFPLSSKERVWPFLSDVDEIEKGSGFEVQENADPRIPEP